MEYSTVSLESALFFETPAQIYARVFRTLQPRATAPGFQIEFRRFANANSFIRMRDGHIEVKMTDALESAPSPIVEALAFILLSKLYRRPVPAEFNERYRRYLNRKDVRQHLHSMREKRGRKLITSAQGHAYDLEAIFDQLNFIYFHGLMARPTIGWSQRRGRNTLGHYDPSHNTIVVSRLLDRPEVPRLVVEYVMFHEMLHVRYPVTHTGIRRCVHTPEFKQAEKAFERIKDARSLLKTL